MAVSSTVPVFIFALLGQLRTRYAANALFNGSTGAVVSVEIVPTGDTSSLDSVTLLAGAVDEAQEHLAFGGSRKETARIPGQLEAYATDPDASTAFVGAWNRAGLLIDEISLELRDNKPNVGAETLDAMIESNTYRPLVADQGGWICRCEFVIWYEAQVL